MKNQNLIENENVKRSVLEKTYFSRVLSDVHISYNLWPINYACLHVIERVKYIRNV